MRSELWRHVLADTLAMRIDLTDGEQGSGYGAAVLGMLALGLVDSIESASVAVVSTVEPDPGNAQIYARLRPIFSGLSDALMPSFAALRAVMPDLPQP